MRKPIAAAILTIAAMTAAYGLTRPVHVHWVIWPMSSHTEPFGVLAAVAIGWVAALIAAVAAVIWSAEELFGPAQS